MCLCGQGRVWPVAAGQIDASLAHTMGCIQDLVDGGMACWQPAQRGDVHAA